MGITVPQSSPKAAYLVQQQEIDAAVKRVLLSGWYVLGEEVSGFEQEFARWSQLQMIVGVASGTDALHLSLRAMGIGVGDEVITSPHTASATISAIELSGAVPILADIDPITYTLDPAAVSRVITARTRAIIPVHLYGMSADMDPLLVLANQFNLVVIEDCAQAQGAVYRGRNVGTMGHLSAFSFYPTKNLGALGDAGAIGSMDSDLEQHVRTLAQYGWKTRYISEMTGLNTRLDELQAAILRVKLRVLTEGNARRNEIAARYTAALSGAVNTPIVPADRKSVFHLYVVRHPEREDFRRFLAERGVGTAIHYPLPIHLQPAYRGKLGDKGSFPHAERAAEQIVSLPLYPELTDVQVDLVIQSVLAYSASK